MKQKDKELLLKDLCARLPYGVILSVGIFDNGDMKYHNKKLDCHSNLLSVIELDGGYYFNGLLCRYSQFTAKPYLRSMSSMTEEEKREIYNWLVENDVDWFDFSKLRLDEILISFDSSWLLVNWLNARHFDYRGLIEKGIALEAPKEMYNIK